MIQTLPNARLEEVFAKAAALPKAKRAAWLDHACGGDPDLRSCVDELIHAHEADGFMDGPDPGSLLEAQLALLKPEEPGDRIGPYKLLEEIGEGGFGTVWIAQQEKPIRRRVALKIIKLGMDTKEVIARFEQERQALAIMDHPNIAKILDAGATPLGRPYFAMELVRGVKITEYCDEAKLSTADRIRLFAAVCLAVQHAHQKGLIHRDLKPSNILITLQDGAPVPKIIDFGVAKATQGRLGERTVYTQFQQMLGTPLYMSPEQAGMASHDIDTRSDIYSLGVLLYELLTGRTPIEQQSMQTAGVDELRRLIREVDPPRPSAKVKALPAADLTTTANRRLVEPLRLPSLFRGDLDIIVMKCLEKDRNRRYATASELAQDLQRHLRHELISARPPTTACLVRRLVARHRLAFVIAAAVIIAFMLGFAACIWLALDAQAKRAEAELHESIAVAALDGCRVIGPSLAKQARLAADQGKVTEAIETLNVTIQLQPDVVEYLMTRADLLQSQLKLAEAAKAYEEVLKIEPSNARAQRNAAVCKLLGSEVVDNTLPLRSLRWLADHMREEGRPQGEMREVGRTIDQQEQPVRSTEERSPELRLTGPVLAMEARSLANQGKFNEAIEKLNLAIQLQPDVVEYRMTKGDLLQCQVKLSEAAEAYQEALQIEPNNPRAQKNAALSISWGAEMVNNRLPLRSLQGLEDHIRNEKRSDSEMRRIAEAVSREDKTTRSAVEPGGKRPQNR